MTKKEYTKDQISELLNNKYVKNCTSKYITFTDEFKLKALELDKKYIFPREIFKKCNFPEYIISSIIPWESLKRFRRLSKEKSLIWNKKWRIKKEKIDFNNLTKDQYIEYLETKLEFYEEMKKYIDSWSL